MVSETQLVKAGALGFLSMRPSRLWRPQNHEMHAGADETQPGRHILKVGILFPTIKVRKEWVVRGETIIQKISRQHTGGATKRKDPPEWSNLRPIDRFPSNTQVAL